MEERLAWTRKILPRLTAWPQVQHDVSQEPQTSQAGQEGFEQHLAETRQSEPASVGAGGSYPHLSAEDRDLIDRAIAQYKAQKDYNRTRSSFILRHFVDWRMISAAVAKRLT